MLREVPVIGGGYGQGPGLDCERAQADLAKSMCDDFEKNGAVLPLLLEFIPGWVEALEVMQKVLESGRERDELSGGEIESVVTALLLQATAQRAILRRIAIEIPAPEGSWALLARDLQSLADSISA